MVGSSISRLGQAKLCRITPEEKKVDSGVLFRVYKCDVISMSTKGFYREEVFVKKDIFQPLWVSPETLRCVTQAIKKGHV